MQKNKLNLHICGIHLLNPYKTVVSHLKAERSMVRITDSFTSGMSFLNSVWLSHWPCVRFEAVHVGNKDKTNDAGHGFC